MGNVVFNATSRRALGAAAVAGLSLGAVPAATAAAGDSSTEASAKADYVVLLKQPVSVAKAGGLDHPAGKAAAQSYTDKPSPAWRARASRPRTPTAPSVASPRS